VITPGQRVVAITDRRMAKRPVEEIVGLALAGGCRAVLLRDKEAIPEQRRALGHAVAKLCRHFGAAFLVHSDAVLAMELQANALHLPQGASITEARAAVSDSIPIGVSCHSLAECLHAEAEGARFVMLSPLFRSVSKPDMNHAMGVERFAEIAGATRLPVTALGGITPENAPAALRAGASAVAVLGGIMAADDPRATTAALVAAVAASV
jgi:thiamine-phosphate pyrophosphorylase